MRFDWYAATVNEDPLVLVQRLAAELGGSAVVTNPHQGYTSAMSIVADGSTVATVYYGGRNGAPHVFASSDRTEAFVEVVRRLWPAPLHYVTRMDAAQDFDEPGAFERLCAVVEGLGEERHLARSTITSLDSDGMPARTVYLGSRKSAVFLRLYEKGKELRTHELPEGVLPSLDLVRMELVVRPEKGKSRENAAVCDPTDAYGYSAWSQELLRLVTGLDVTRVVIKQARRSDQDRALQAMSEQYARHIANYSDELGSAESFGVEIVRRALIVLSRKEGAA